ncbi:HAMP domain-containing histidine kinase, partial [Candidatus Binatia bacterium]|nr:HAMP domain-containing histidine kinase [Candidatus Binatia bacterium]
MEHTDHPPHARDTAGSLGLERFCVALCHDLRGPVATAGAALHRLSHRLPHEIGELPHLIEIARESIAKADELLTSLPALLAREAEARLDAVALDAVVATVHDDVGVELRLAGAALEVRGRLPVVLADAERLRVALRNLVRNALQHRRPDVATRITLRAWRRGATWTLTLSDNGAGIPRGERARVFAPLQRGTGASGAGSGLGLTIARRAVEACGGTLTLGTRPGTGTSFAITLRGAPAPRAPAALPPAAP